MLETWKQYQTFVYFLLKISKISHRNFLSLTIFFFVFKVISSKIIISLLFKLTIKTAINNFSDR